jgi:hypothetical protein
VRFPLISAFALSLFIAAFPVSGLASATDVYITPDGTGQGVCTASPHNPAWFNSSANWGNAQTQIGPGTTVHLCGTFTGTAGGTMLSFKGSGTSGQPIVLLGETGAIFTSPYWSGDTANGGAINTGGQSYITINGGPTCGWSPASQTVTPCNMAIVNTQNGTGLANAAASIGIEVGAGSRNVEIKNTDCHNIYTHTAGGSDDSANYTSQMCIFMAYSGAGASNVTIDHNILHDAGWVINAGVDNITIGPGNEIYNADHDIASAPVHGYIFGNHFHDWANWNGFGAHHDGFHCFAGTSAGASQALYIYGNQFDGDPGPVGLTGFVFLEGQGSSTTCFAPGAQGVYLFNNVAILANNSGGNFWLLGNQSGAMANAFVANNTVIGNQPTSTSSDGSFVFQDVNGSAVLNNANGGLSILLGQHSGVSWSSTPDYNFYENCISGGPCFAALGQSTNSFATWQHAGYDAHGGANLNSTNNFGLNPACTPGSVGANCSPQSNSPLIASGKNLSSMCAGQPNPGIGALCYDVTGSPRPTTGVWDAGAYQTGGGAPPAPPSGLVAIVQ